MPEPASDDKTRARKLERKLQAHYDAALATAENERYWHAASPWPRNAKNPLFPGVLLSEGAGT